jgi:hypothetical protein
MDDRETKVHAHHCCKKHGCKYGDDDCPVAYGDVEQVYPCPDCDDYYGDEPNFDIKAPDIEWVMKERRNGYDRERKSFWKGFITGFLIIIIFHIGLAYALL